MEKLQKQLHIHYWLTNLHSKKFWAKYNPALGKIWMNPAIGLNI